MKYLYLLLFVVLQFFGGYISIFIFMDVRGMIGMPILMLIIGIILKVTNKNEIYSGAIWYLLWSSAVMVLLMIPLEFVIRTIQC